MNTAKIGLKLANGGFYPVLRDGVPARKRLIVTTVKDGQRSVQIDLYRGEGPRVEDAAYVGSLVVENIPEAPRGEPDIRLELGLDAEGVLSAFVEDPRTGERQSLKVSLVALSEETNYEIPDFDLEEGGTDELPREAEGFDEASSEDSDSLLAAAEEIRGRSSRRRVLSIVLFSLLALVLAFGFAFFVYRCSAGEGPAPRIVESPALPAAEPPRAAAAPEPAPERIAAPPPAPAPAPEAPPQAQAPAAAAAPPPPPPAPAAAEAPSAPSGLRYRIRWGDTLWDLSYAHYRNPWLYPKIASYNKIRDPDLIISGTWITIPPR